MRCANMNCAGIANLGWRFYIVFAAFNLAFIPFIWFFYIETAGLSLEQIDRVFDVKYEGGSQMSYTQARKIVLEEGNGVNDEKVRNDAEHVEN